MLNKIIVLCFVIAGLAMTVIGFPALFGLHNGDVRYPLYMARGPNTLRQIDNDYCMKNYWKADPITWAQCENTALINSPEAQYYDDIYQKVAALRMSIAEQQCNGDLTPVQATAMYQQWVGSLLSEIQSRRMQHLKALATSTPYYAALAHTQPVNVSCCSDRVMTNCSSN